MLDLPLSWYFLRYFYSLFLSSFVCIIERISSVYLYYWDEYSRSSATHSNKLSSTFHANNHQPIKRSFRIIFSFNIYPSPISSPLGDLYILWTCRLIGTVTRRESLPIVFRFTSTKRCRHRREWELLWSLVPHSLAGFFVFVIKILWRFSNFSIFTIFQSTAQWRKM